jgi:hypothetical protein
MLTTISFTYGFFLVAHSMMPPPIALDILRTATLS